MASKNKAVVGNNALKSEFNRFNSSSKNRNNNNITRNRKDSDIRSDASVVQSDIQPESSTAADDKNIKKHDKDTQHLNESPSHAVRKGDEGNNLKRQNNYLHPSSVSVYKNNPYVSRKIYIPKIPDSQLDGTDRPPSPKTDIQHTRNRPIHKRGRRDIPVSIESEYRFILGVTKRCSNELKAFRNRYKTDGFDLARCKDTAVDIVKSIGLEESEIDRADEFRKLLATRKLPAEIQNRPEVEHLEILCDQTAKYEEMMPDVQARLNNCVKKHLSKYCLSFHEELKHHENVKIKCVHDYEETLTGHSSSLDERLKSMHDSYESYCSQRTPFITGYLQSAADLIQTMTKNVTVGLEVCDIINKWCYADKLYPGKLWEGITVDNRVKVNKQESLKKVRDHKEEHLVVLHKKEIIRDKAAAKFNEVKSERRKLTTHKENLSKRIEQTENELTDKQNEHEDVMHEYNNRKYNSPKYVEKLWDKKDLLEMETFKLDERLNMLKRQQERYDKLEADLEEQLTDLEYDVIGKQGDVDDVRNKVKSCDNDINHMIKDLKSIDNKITAAKVIRDMKLSAATLRKIYFQKLDSSSHDLLMDVCKVVAANIGRAWESLYLDLPFTPPRSSDKRLYDLEKIKVNSVHREITGRKLAWQGLQKWRIFHKNGSVEQMMKSLRKLEKYALAHKVEHMSKKSNTIH